MSRPRIAIGPADAAFAEEAVRGGGGLPVALGEPADAVVWLSPHELGELKEALAAQPGIRWVQLPFAGVEHAMAASLLDESRVWSCAKGLYARPVAEHALLLALALLRRLPERVRARSWGTPAGISLYGAPVTIVGGGGIASELLRLLSPFGVEATVVRRLDRPLQGARRTLTTDRLEEGLEGARVVFLGLALTPETERIIGARQLDAMGPQAFLVNVARGRHVDTGALVGALEAGRIAGAGLDVTEPEPLPDGHRLWTLDNCIVTPHTADTWEMIVPLLAARIRANVSHFARSEQLEGIVDPVAGY